MKFSKIAGALLICFLYQPTHTQNYHTPAEILEILTNSFVNYEIGSLETRFTKEQNEELTLNQRGVYIEENEKGQPVLKFYELSPEAFKFLEIGRSSLQSGEMEKARAGYQAALKLSPGNSQLITYIGQTYEEEYNHNEAKKWYKKAIKTNRLEYLAHWFLADIHYSEGDTKEAVYEITIAHILNRNNSSVIERLLAIYSNQGIEYLNWDFDPIYELSKNEDNSISLRYDPKHSEWVSYALCKAVWAYEPGYKDNMLLDTPNIPSLVEEVECFLNVIIAFKEKYGNQKSDDEAVNRLIKAFEKNYITEFVLYEKLLIEDPLIAYLIDKESIDMVVDYILKFRTKKI